MKNAGKRYFTITEAARKLGITRAAVYRAVKQKRLEAREAKIIQVKTVKVTIRALRISAKSLKNYRVSMLHQWVGKKTD